jgi:hypothetical protein
LRWADKIANASHRDVMIRVAKHWMNTASAIQRRLVAGDELALPDLRTKLD